MTITHLKEGDKAPAFEGIDQDGNTIKLEDYKGKKLILFFYPKDNTPGCTAEVCRNKYFCLGFERNCYKLFHGRDNYLYSLEK